MGRPKNTQGQALAVEDTTKMETVREPFVADLTNLTPEELAIAKRVAHEDDAWQTITEGDINDFSLSEDPFKLPPPAAKAEKERRYAFRWIVRNPQRLDEIKSKPIPLRWWICNRTTTPFLSAYVDPILGCVARHDQMLVFKPWWMHEKERQAKWDIAASLENRGVDEKSKQEGFEGGSRFSDSKQKLTAEIRGTGDIVDAEEMRTDARTTVLTDDLIDTEAD